MLGIIFRDSVTYNFYTTLDFCMLGSIIGKILLYVHVYNSQFETLNENIVIARDIRTYISTSLLLHMQ